MRIAVLDDYQAVAHAMADWTSLADCSVEFLHAPLQDVDALAERLRDVDAIVAMRERTKFPAAVFARLPRLRLLVTTGMINRSIDLQAAAERGVRVCGTPWAEDATVEVTWGHVLALAHRIPREDAAMRAGGWQTALGRSLHGRTLGLLGLGTIGSKVARIAQAFGMQVIAHSPNLTPERAAAAGARCVDKAELFRAADVLSIHLILGPTTRAIVGAAELALMKPDAFLVNTSRGPLVDQAALLAALHAGRLAGVGLDVYDEEPLPRDHPLRSAPRTLLTPHIGYVTEEVYRAWYGAAIEAIAAFRAGRPIRVLTPAA